MIRNQQLLPALAVVVMAVIGWKLGGTSAEKTSGVPPSANTRSSRPERPLRTRPGPSGEAAQRLAAISAATSPAERTRATIDLANTLPLAEFAAWLDGDWFTPRNGMESTVFFQILTERWAQEDPVGLLLWSRKNSSDAGNSVLSDWAKNDPERLLEFFRSHPDDQAEIGGLRNFAKMNPELALQRLLEMITAGTSVRYDYQARRVLNELAEQSPAKLEAVIDTLPSSLQPDAEKFLIRQKLKDSFDTEFQKLLDRPDGLTLFKEIFAYTSPLCIKLIGGLKNLPASWKSEIASVASTFVNSRDAIEWLATDLEGAGFTADQVREIRIQAASVLIYDAPETTLKLMADLDLPPEKKVVLLDSIFWPLKDKPEQGESLLALLGSDEDRQMARDALQPPSNPEPAIKKIDQPAEWIATVMALDFEKEDPSNYLDMLGGWEPGKVAALAANFKSLSDDKKRNLANFIIEDGRGRSSPLRSEALAYIIAHPKDLKVADDPFAGPDDRRGTSQVIELASFYVAEIGTENPGKAGEWVQSLPDGEAKFYAAKNLQSVWSLYDPEAAERWMKSLPDATRAKVRDLK